MATDDSDLAGCADHLWRSEDGRILLLHGDCFALAPLLGPCARLAFFSPPYNVNMAYEGGQDWSVYATFVRAMAAMCESLLEPSGYAQVNFLVRWKCPYSVEGLYREAFADVGMEVFAQRFWKKRFDTLRRKAYNHQSARPLAEVEYIHTFRRTADRGWDKPRDLERSLMAVWDTSEEPRGVLADHPAAFPSCLPGWGMDVHCDCESDQLVIDPFMGTGATILAAAKRGLRAIGIEIFAEYYDRALTKLNGLL